MASNREVQSDGALESNDGNEASDHYVRHGGVHFRNNVSPQEINNFIRKLPAGKRDSLFEVLEQLDNAGMITIVNDHVFADGNGMIGGGESHSD